MSTVETVIKRVGYRVGSAISADSNPGYGDVITWIDETVKWISILLAEYGSEIGRTTGTITTSKATITAITQAASGQVSAASHGFSNSDSVLIKSVVGMTEVNDLWHTVAGSTDDTFTIGSTSANTAYSSGGYVYKAKYSTIASNMYMPCNYAWIHKQYDRVKIDLVTEKETVKYSPSEIGEPEFFHVDESGNITYFPTPDDDYTIYHPYWSIQTTLNEKDDTMPFNGLLDTIIVDAVVMRALNRKEYDISVELKWFSFINDRIKALAWLRKNKGVSVGR